MIPSEYRDRLKERLGLFDKAGATEICKALIVFLYQSNEPFDKKIAESILQLLRNHRMFDWMQRVADALIFTERHTFKIYRQNAQSLIDSGSYSAALSVLNELSGMTKNALPDNKEAKSEGVEAEGLIGRLYKQLYVNAIRIGSYNGQFLRRSLQSYYTVYTDDPSLYLWHGINVVAMLHRAKKDGVPVSGYPNYLAVADEILGIIEEKDQEKKTETWDYATAAEACVALGRPDEAEKWIAYYASNKGCDAFELASTLRQFEEVWKLDLNSEMGRRVLTILRNELLKREGGNVVIEATEVQRQNQMNLPFEKNFGNNVFIDFVTYKKGYACCEAVARIGRFTQKGDGTGFLLPGKELHEQLDDELVLLTNAHVVSEDDMVRMSLGALHPTEAIIIFEALDRQEEFHVGSLLFYSPPLKLDVAIIRFPAGEQDRLKQLTKNVTPYKLASALPVAKGDPSFDPRLYVIGHPKGGPLQFSMQDNLLLDCQEPLIHYRTPTEGGSSGSPVFNQQWELVGLHHSGSKEMKRLNSKEGFYEANEGIWIQSIKKAFEEKLGG